MPFARKLGHKILDHLASTLVLGGAAVAVTLAVSFKNHLLDAAKQAIGTPEIESRLTAAEKNLRDLADAASTLDQVERRLTATEQNMRRLTDAASTQETIVERLNISEKRLQDLAQNTSTYDQIGSRLSTIEDHLHDLGQAASTTVDTVYVIKHEFAFPRPVMQISQETKAALARCAFDEVDVSSHDASSHDASSHDASTVYIERLKKAATIGESFRFRADVGTRAELQYDMRCYTHDGGSYKYPKPLDLELHVDSALLPRHEPDWSNRPRRPMRPVDSSTESVETGTFRIYQLTIYLAQGNAACPSHFPKVVNGDLSACTFDGLIHVSDKMPILQPSQTSPRGRGS